MTKTSPAATATIDAGKVRLGGISRSLPRPDAGKDRHGGMPCRLSTKDGGKVRMGGISRSLPR